MHNEGGVSTHLPRFLSDFAQLLSRHGSYISENYFHIRAMIKKMLFILSLICLFASDGKIATDENSISALSPTAATILDELPDSGAGQKQIDYKKLSQFKCTGLCVTPRSPVLQESYERQVKVVSRQFEVFLQKGQNLLNKTSETLRIVQSIKFSSLRIRAGHWAYVLRKIII